MPRHSEQPRKPSVHPLTKEERAKDAALAMQEYLAGKRVAQEKTARLRQLRLARDAQAAADAAQSKPLKRSRR